jgi:hypothetical protein
VPEALDWMDRGSATFSVKDPHTGLSVAVQPCACGTGPKHIKTKPNKTKADNLDSLPYCK